MPVFSSLRAHTYTHVLLHMVALLFHNIFYPTDKWSGLLCTNTQSLTYDSRYLTNGGAVNHVVFITFPPSNPQPKTASPVIL